MGVFSGISLDDSDDEGMALGQDEDDEDDEAHPAKKKEKRSAPVVVEEEEDDDDDLHLLAAIEAAEAAATTPSSKQQHISPVHTNTASLRAAAPSSRHGPASALGNSGLPVFESPIRQGPGLLSFTSPAAVDPSERGGIVSAAQASKVGLAGKRGRACRRMKL
jgi:hypothetical protein